MIEFGSETLVITHDAMAEGTHWRPGTDPYDIAWKLVATNLSDLAAKGAEPVGVLLSHVLGDGDDRFLEGLCTVLARHDTPILGGDTIAAAPGARTLGLTAIGRATCAKVPSRAGARAGDRVLVTGTLGRAMLGFDGDEGHREAFLRPAPRLAEGRALAPVVSAMMDISDGLLLDAFRLAQASEATIAIESDAVPVADPDRREDSLRWGDDYELLFTLPEDAACPVEASAIGRVEPAGFAPLMLDGHPLLNAAGLGFAHG
ncbi:thiamine-monophosphate kinase [Qipengyuania nanhaisediminis]